jgi:hypothetical protein
MLKYAQGRKGEIRHIYNSTEIRKDYAYPIASSLLSCSFRALRTSVSLAFFTTAGSYDLNLRLGAPQTVKNNCNY